MHYSKSYSEAETPHTNKPLYLVGVNPLKGGSSRVYHDHSETPCEQVNTYYGSADSSMNTVSLKAVFTVSCMAGVFGSLVPRLTGAN